MLDNKRIGFIGAGMMAEAIARGLIKAGVETDRITTADPDKSRLAFWGQDIGVVAAEDNVSVAQSSDILILAVKPHIIPEVLSEISSILGTGQLLISIAAGVTTDFIQDRLRAEVPIVRVMPNTPCLIGQGASALSPGRFARMSHMDIASEIFSAVGRVVQIGEDKIDAVTGLSGSGPAYVYTFIESLADGGVRMGLPRAVAVMLAAQTVAGSAQMVLEIGEHPAVLRDKVTTPEGTTIAGTAVLERAKFRSAIIEAVTAATHRAAELGRHSKG